MYHNTKRCILCTYKPGFLTLGHIYKYTGILYRKSAKVHVKNVHFLNVRAKKYSRSEDSYVLQCILLKTFVRLISLF